MFGQWGQNNNQQQQQQQQQPQQQNPQGGAFGGRWQLLHETAGRVPYPLPKLSANQLNHRLARLANLSSSRRPLVLSVRV